MASDSGATTSFKFGLSYQPIASPQVVLVTSTFSFALASIW